MTQPIYADLRQFEAKPDELCLNTGYGAQIGVYRPQIGLPHGAYAGVFRMGTCPKNSCEMQLSKRYKGNYDTGIRTRRFDKNRKGAAK